MKANQSKLQELRVEAKKTADVHNRLKQEMIDHGIKDKSKMLLKDIVANLVG